MKKFVKKFVTACLFVLPIGCGTPQATTAPEIQALDPNPKLLSELNAAQSEIKIQKQELQQQRRWISELESAGESHMEREHPEPVLDPGVMSFPGLPMGFPEQDPYSGISEACVAVTKKLAPKKFQRVVLDYCEHRSFHSSRYKIVVSRVDGSQIHDRDRPTAWIFYQRGVLSDRLTPETCEYHKIDRTIKHPAKELWLTKKTGEEENGKAVYGNWPFKSPKMSPYLKKQWLSHPYDMERFGARGPHDWNANAYKYLEGSTCWDPASLERNDVAAEVTVSKAIGICEEHGCRTKWDIKKYW
jgi:hypothetical protein